MRRKLYIVPQKFIKKTNASKIVRGAPKKL